MIRKMTACILILAIIAGGFLFKTSQNVQKTESKIADLSKKNINEEDNLRVLKTEWSYLNQPQNLEKLAKKHLTNKITKPIDLVSFEKLNLQNKKIIDVAMVVNDMEEMVEPEPLKPVTEIKDNETSEDNIEVAVVEEVIPEVKEEETIEVTNVSLPIKKPYFKAKNVAYTPKKINNRPNKRQFKDFNSLLESLE